jgi:hypothetical protein
MRVIHIMLSNKYDDFIVWARTDDGKLIHGYIKGREQAKAFVESCGGKLDDMKDMVDYRKLIGRNTDYVFDTYQ